MELVEIILLPHDSETDENLSLIIYTIGHNFFSRRFENYCENKHFTTTFGKPVLLHYTRGHADDDDNDER